MEILIPGLQLSIVFQCLLFALYLRADERRDTLANRINLALLAVLGTHMLFNLVDRYLLVNRLPNLVFGFGLFYGPAIYFYIQALIYRDFRWQRTFWLHLVPGATLCLLPLWFQPTGAMGALATFLSMGAYLALSLRHYWRFRRTLDQTQSDVDRLAMRWAINVLRLFGASLLFNVASVGVGLFTGNPALSIWAEICLLLVLLTVAGAFVFKGLVQPVLFAGISDEDAAIAEQSTSNAPIAGLDAARHDAIRQKLLAHMEEKKPYRDSLFNLQLLGRQLGETPRYVSAVINRDLQLNFADFVNEYRLAEVKQCLADAAESRTILDIIYASGFSTKSNFNRAFKQREGMTPSEFRRRALGTQADKTD